MPINKVYKSKLAVKQIAIALLLMGIYSFCSASTITGKVFVDLNSDGIENGADKGMPAVTVILYNDNGSIPGEVDAGDTQLSTTDSDKNGNYTFTGLGAGNYVMELDANDLPSGFTITTGGDIAVTFTGSSEASTGNDFGYNGQSVVCYGFSDATNQCYIINRYSGEAQLLGAAGVPNIEAVTFNITADTLFAANDPSQFGWVNLQTGAFNVIGTTGTGSGALGNISFTDPDGLAVDTDGTIWACHRRTGANDVLFKINRATGAHIPDAFGAGVDYVELTGPDNLPDMDDIGIDPSTGILYGVNNGGGSADQMLTINKTTGVCTLVGAFGINDMEGAGFTSNGDFYGTTGNAGAAATNDRLWSLNKSTGAATEVGAFGAGGDYEGCDCIYTPAVISDLSLTKASSVSQAGAGATVVYTVSVSNAGPDEATGVKVKDQLPAEVTYVSDDSGGNYNSTTGIWDVGTMAASTTQTIEITVTVTTTGGTITNVAQVFDNNVPDIDSNPNNDDGDQSEDDEAAASVDASGADLSLTKSVSPSAVNLNDNVTFTITVTNDGPTDATLVEVLDQLPSGLNYVSNNPSQGTYTSGTGIWNVGSIANGASATLEIVATVTDFANADNIAQVNNAGEFDTDSTPGNSVPSEDDQDNAAPTELEADLSLTKTVSAASVDVGNNVTFTITVSNAGPDAATNVAVLDVLPVGLTYVSDNSGGAYNDGTGLWTVGTIANGSSASIQITATVTTAALHNNSAQVSASDQYDPDSTVNNSVASEDDQADVNVTGNCDTVKSQIGVSN